MAAVNRGGLTPEPSTANHFPVGRTAVVRVTRGNEVVAVIPPAAVITSLWNPGFAASG